MSSTTGAGFEAMSVSDSRTVLPGASDKRISDRAADTTTASLTVKGFSTRSIAELGGTFHSIRVAANPGAITSKVPGPFGTCGSTNSPFEWDFVLPEKLG